MLLQYYEHSTVLQCMLSVHAIPYSGDGARPLCQQQESSGRGSSVPDVPFCPRRIIRALWIVGEGERWCRLSCIPEEM